MSTVNVPTTNSSTTESPTQSSSKKSTNEKNRSKSDDPSMDEIISGIISLIGGNVKQLTSGHRQSANKPANFPVLPSIPDEGDFYTANGVRINNRGPAFNDPNSIGHAQNVHVHQHAPLPPSVLIGPGANYGLPLSQAHHRVIASNDNNVNGGRPVSKPPPSQIYPVNIHESDIASLLGQRLNYNYNNYKGTIIPGNGILPKYPQDYHHKPNLQETIQPLNLPPGHETGLNVQNGGFEYPQDYNLPPGVHQLPPGMQLPPGYEIVHPPPGGFNHNPSLNDHRTTTGVLIPASSHQYPHPDYVHVNTNLKHQEPHKGDGMNNKNKDQLHLNKGQIHPSSGHANNGNSNNNHNGQASNNGNNVNKKQQQHSGQGNPHQNINWYSSDPSSVMHMNGHNQQLFPSSPLTGSSSSSTTLVPSQALLPGNIVSSSSAATSSSGSGSSVTTKGDPSISHSFAPSIQATKATTLLLNPSTTVSGSVQPQDLLEAAGSNKHEKGENGGAGNGDNGNESSVNDWLSLGAIKPTRTWSEGPPIIITQEEPSVFDITIKHKLGAGIGTSVGTDTSFKVTVPLPTESFMSTTRSPTLLGNLNADEITPTISASTVIESEVEMSSDAKPEEVPSVTTRATRIRPSRLQPTRVRTSGIATTFVPTAQLRLRPGSGQQTKLSVTPSQVVSSEGVPSSSTNVPDQEVIVPSKVSTTPEVSTSTITVAGVERIQESSEVNGSVIKSNAINATSKGSDPDRDGGSSGEIVDIVYGKPVDTNRPTAPDLSPSGDATSVPTNFIPGKVDRTSIITTSTSYNQRPGAGRPVIIPVDMDEVKPNMAGGVRPSRTRGRPSSGQDVVTDRGSVYIDGRPTHIKLRPAPTAPTMQVGGGVTVHVANDKQSGHEQPEYGQGSVGNVAHVLSPDGRPNRGQSSPTKPSTIRRQPFRPRPVVPLVRIDTCIVGDDTTCDMKMNERCRTELGISSCQCKPGYGRSTPRGMCNPIVTLSLSLRLDRLGDNKLVFNRNYLNPNSEEYQFLEYESVQGLNSLFATSRLSKIFNGIKINKFYQIANKMMVNASIELENSNITRTSGVKRVLIQELQRVLALKNHVLGDSTISIEPPLTSPSSSTNPERNSPTSAAVTRVDDVNECSSAELNDCSPNAVCINDFGSFRCLCKKGYDDKYASDPKKSGRQCLSCSPAYCSNRGECTIVNGEKECKCRGNFIGSKCDIDIEVLGVAVGGSVAALVIIVITFLCLYMWK